jgi:hypothetical protein
MPLSDLRCPDCLRVLQFAISVGRKGAPKTGDFTLCSGCGAILRFGSFGFTRSTPEELRKHGHPVGVDALLMCREQVLARPRN